MIRVINSSQNALIKETCKLFQSKERKAKNRYLVEGFHMLEMALEDKLVESVFSLKPLQIDTTIPQYIISDDILRKLTKSKNPQGVVAIVNMKKTHSIEGERVLYLDEINDPGNLGTIIRSALAFNYCDIILSKGCVSPYNEKALQASQGAIFRVNLVFEEQDNLVALKEKGYQIIASSSSSGIDIASFHASAKHVIILGNETHGIQKKVFACSDTVVSIRIKGIESLNVAVAGGILMAYLARKE